MPMFGFFKKGNDKSSHELSVKQANEIRKQFKDQYDIEIYREAYTPDDMKCLGYRKIAPNAATSLNMLFRYIPQLAVDKINHAAVDTAFKAAVDGSFRVRLGAGMHMPHSKLHPEAFRAMGFSDVTNKLSGQAELFKNNAVLNVSNAPQVALGIFNVASLITGQYFMSQINGKLLNLSSSVNRIEQFLEAEQRSKLKAAIQELENIIAHLEFIKQDADKTRSKIDRLLVIQNSAREAMNLYQERIANELASVQTTDKEDEILRMLNSIGSYLIQYRYAVQLYGYAIMIEIQLQNVVNLDELEEYRNDINGWIHTFQNDISKYTDDLNNYLNENKSLNKRGVLQYLSTFGAAAGGAWLKLPFATNTSLAKSIDELFDGRRKKKKEECVLLADNYLNQISDMDNVEAPARTLSHYIEIMENEIELVRVGSDYYTNIPEAL